MSFRTLYSYFSLLFLLVPALACADGDSMNRIQRERPVLSGFDICYGGGCAAIAHVAISEAEWQAVQQTFQPQSDDAAQERQQIARAIGILETLVGAKTGTSGDRGGTFGNSAYPGQLDCNDEATNSKTYLKLMQQAGLIRLHEILDTKTRGFFIIHGWPHTTAVIRDKFTSRRYAVDSWFYDNGRPAVIIPLEQWATGWKPSDSAAH